MNILQLLPALPRSTVTSLNLKSGHSITPFLVTTTNGARCVVIINTPDNQSDTKAKENGNGESVLVRNKDVFLPQIMDVSCDDSMETGKLL